MKILKQYWKVIVFGIAGIALLAFMLWARSNKKAIEANMEQSNAEKKLTAAQAKKHRTKAEEAEQSIEQAAAQIAYVAKVAKENGNENVAGLIGTWGKRLRKPA